MPGTFISENAQNTDERDAKIPIGRGPNPVGPPPQTPLQKRMTVEDVSNGTGVPFGIAQKPNGGQP
jgi:hypothetical protein